MAEFIDNVTIQGIIVGLLIGLFIGAAAYEKLTRQRK